MVSSKIKCIIIDEDQIALCALRDLCHDFPMVKVAATFHNPREFIHALPDLDFDLCLLEISMASIDGITVAKQIEDKHIIFVTGIYEKLKEALSMAPIDIIAKPYEKARLGKALQRAYDLSYGKNTVSTKQEYELFNIAQRNGKVKLKLSDFLYIQSDSKDPRNKQIILKGGDKCTLMGYSFKELISLTPLLVQVNRSTAISIEIVQQVQWDIVTLHSLSNIEMQKQVILNRRFREEFLNRITK